MQDIIAQGRPRQRLLAGALALGLALPLAAAPAGPARPASAAATSAPAARPPKENPVTPQLTVHELDVQAYPELERAPGVYGIEPALLRPDADPRMAAPQDALLLLRVSFTLLQADVPWGSHWQLEATGLDADGKPRRQQWQLVPPPPKHENRRRLTPDRDTEPTPGALDRGVFWLDLSGPLRSKSLRPGDQLTLRLAKAQATLTMPAVPGR
jgi:hypothetical protein